MKVYLIVDLPDGEDINECVADMFIHDLNVRGIAKYNDVPLRPLPEKIWHEEGKENECEEWHKNGWNACLDEILGDYITQEEADLCGVQFWHDD